MHDKYMLVVKKAISLMDEQTTLIEAMADICTERKIDLEDFAVWVKKYIALKETIEVNSKKYKLLVNSNEKTTNQTVSLLEIF